MRLFTLDRSPFLTAAFFYDNVSRTIVDWVIDNPKKNQILDDVYYGKVLRVVPHLGGAFVDIGLSKDAFLKTKRKIKAGEHIVTQVVKEPYQRKGAQLSEDITLGGRHCVYMPYGSGLKRSSKLEDTEEVEALCSALEALLDAEDGAIVRTEAGAFPKEAVAELKELKETWTVRIQRATLEKKAVCLWCSNDVQRVLADKIAQFSPEKCVVGDGEAVKWLKTLGVESAKIQLSNSGLSSAQAVHVPVDYLLTDAVYKDDSGVSIVVDELEAFTIVDVNSEHYDGGNAPSWNTNEIAIRLVKRVLEQRRIGGVVLVDLLTLSPQDKERFIKSVVAPTFGKREGYRVMGYTALGLLELLRYRREISVRDSLSIDFRARDLSYWKLHELYFELLRLERHTNTRAVTLSVCEPLYELLKQKSYFDALSMDVKLKLLKPVETSYKIKTLDTTSEL